MYTHLQIYRLDVQSVGLENCSKQIRLDPMQRDVYLDSVGVLGPAACCQDSERLHHSYRHCIYGSLQHLSAAAYQTKAHRPLW